MALRYPHHLRQPWQLIRAGVGTDPGIDGSESYMSCDGGIRRRLEAVKTIELGVVVRLVDRRHDDEGAATGVGRLCLLERSP